MSDTVTTTLTEFLLARIAEDEAAWTTAKEMGVTLTNQGSWKFVPARPVVDQMLAECEAKRRIVERCELVLKAFDDGVMWSNVNRRERSHAHRTIRTLASVYADHPDYDPEWAA